MYCIRLVILLVFDKNFQEVKSLLGSSAHNPLNSDSDLSKNYVIYFIESPLKMMKNAFYFILKALYVLKIFNFLSQLFDMFP